MGIDFHLGNHYYSFHLPTPVLVFLRAVVVYAVWKMWSA